MYTFFHTEDSRLSNIPCADVRDYLLCFFLCRCICYVQCSVRMTQRGPAASATLPLSAPALPAAKLGDRAFERVDKASAELFAITYGALVRQMLVDYGENVDVVNAQLDQLGERIGVRLVEEFAARSGAPPCRTAAQAAENAAKIGFKMFLGINANVEMLAAGGAPPSSAVSPASSASPTTSTSAGDAAASITFDDNPLNLFVELPDSMRSSMWYSNVLCGVLRGALGQVGHITQVAYVRDTLRGDDTNEIRVKFQGREKETFKVDMQK